MNNPVLSGQRLIAAAAIILTIVLPFQPALGAEQEVSQADQQDELSTANLEDLITTLESETARQEFLANLQTLLAARGEQDSEQSFSLGSWFDVDGTSNEFLTGYVAFFDDMGLNSSSAGSLLMLLIVLIMVLVFILINNRLSRLLDERMNALRRSWNTQANRFRLIFRLQRWFGIAIGLLLFLYTLSDSYPALRSLFGTESIAFLAGLTASMMLLAFLLVVVWEFINALMEYGMSERSHANTTRIKTLLPVVRNLAFFAICGFAILVFLSELGIDVVPLLAGAGVLGIAIGFGAQTLVKDYINGFIVIFENLFQVDDVVAIGGRTGQVEQITLRKIQLRNLDGTVHTIPHSEITVIDNLTKGYSYYLTDIGVAYKEDVDEVIDCLYAVHEDLQADDDFKDKILEPIEIFGLDKFADSSLNIKVRIKTGSHDRWSVGREFNRRVKIAFDKAGIEIPFPHRTLFINQDEHVSDKQS